MNVIEEKFSRCPRCRSFSVQQNPLNMLERIKQYFLPVTAFFCNNCSYRYAIHGKLSLGYKKNWIAALVPLVIIVVAALFIFLSGSGQPTPPIEKPVDKPPVQEQQVPDQKPEETPEQQDINQQQTEEQPQTDQTQDQPPEQTQDQPPETTETAVEQTGEQTDASEVPEGPEIKNEIVLGNSNRFGVNWRTVQMGVQISRLSPGPLKTAGLKLGDIIAEVDGERVTNGSKLMRTRNEIFTGRKEEAIVKVLQGTDEFYYRLVKLPAAERERIKQQQAEEEKKNQEQQNEIKNEIKPETATVAPVAVATGSPMIYKVFPASTIKSRSSLPDTVDMTKRWCFLKKQLTITRAPEQKVLVAGDEDGEKKWAVDDMLIINGKVYQGVTNNNYSLSNGYLPRHAKLSPLDITGLIPPNRPTRLMVQLADHGRMWANTDIFIVVK